MSNLPEQFPYERENAASGNEVSADQLAAAEQPLIEAPSTEFPGLIEAPPAPILFTEPAAGTQIFEQFKYPPTPRQERIPNFGHLVILGLLALCGLFGASLVAHLALHYHLFGVTNIAQAASEVHYTLGTEGVFYFLTFAECLLIFPVLWHKGLLEGLHWQGSTAFRRSGYLVAAAVACFVLALINGMLLPGPVDAPIDKIFRLPGAAWMLFAFGVTLAPFFEELAFRGFLLPALCTSFDWIAEKAADEPQRPLDEDGHPQWSMPSMVVASILTSILFAFMHADQTGYSIGPFLLLICVSLVLCWARLSTRSLAASVLVHACYNFLLFSLMFFGTGGFRHLDRM
jgi:membrane protease YdiL (CAAX protease family)